MIFKMSNTIYQLFVLFFLLITATSGKRNRWCSIKCPHMLNVTHILCLQSKCPNYIPYNESCHSHMHQSERKYILKLHNDIRRLISTDLMKERYNVLPAANMFVLNWDPDLEALATCSALLCKLVYTCSNFPYAEVGQNIGYVDDTQEEYLEALGVRKIIYNWFYQITRHDFSKLYQSNSTAKSFTQMIWARSRLIGCGQSMHKLNATHYRMILVCNYLPRGNINGKEVYLEGKPCSKCQVVCQKQIGMCGVNKEDIIGFEHVTEMYKEIFNIVIFALGLLLVICIIFYGSN